MRVTVYRNYRFIDKDPVIDAMRTVVKSEEKLSNHNAHQISGVATATFDGWFDGGTRKPQNASVTQAMGALGYVRRDVLNKDGTVTPAFARARDLNYKEEITKQADWFLKHHAKKKRVRRVKKKNGSGA